MDLGILMKISEDKRKVLHLGQSNMQQCRLAVG